MSQLVFLIGVYKCGLRASTNQFLTFPWWELLLGGLCASGWGNVKNFFENVLLAGEMLKSEKPTFNISPVAYFWVGGGCVPLAGEMLNTFLQMCFWMGKCSKVKNQLTNF